VFSYADTQRYRLGTNYLQLPVNRPACSVANNQRDGLMQYAPYGGGTVNYEPSSLIEGSPQEMRQPPLENAYYEGYAARKKIELTNDFEQAGQRYRSLKKDEQDHLVDNIADSLSKANKNIQHRMVHNLSQADVDLGKRVGQGVHL
jgi:catalase